MVTQGRENIKARESEGFLNRLAKNYAKRKLLYWMMLPVMVYYIIFHYVPMLGQVIAFQDFRPARGFFDSSWVGLKNFYAFFNGPFSGRVIRNTLLLNVLDLLFGFPMPILLALLLNELKDNAFKRTAQTLTYMPHFVSLVVICSMIRMFTSTSGVITSVLASFGSERTNLLSKQDYYRTIYIASNIWQSIGWSSIIYLATLSRVDPNLHEAAAIDGAGRFRRIWHITIPTLIPIIAIQLILRIGSMMSEGAQKTILLYSPVVYETADIISSYVYRVGINEQNFSIAAAVGMFNSIINLFLLYFANSFSRAYVEESLW